MASTPRICILGRLVAACLLTFCLTLACTESEGGDGEGDGEDGGDGGNGACPTALTQVQVNAPESGATLRAGEACAITWCAPVDVQAFIVSFSADSGRSWRAISSTVFPILAPAQAYTWTPSASDVTRGGRIRVADLLAQQADYSDVGPMAVVAD
jgi:hypothetical protein